MGTDGKIVLPWSARGICPLSGGPNMMVLSHRPSEKEDISRLCEEPEKTKTSVHLTAPRTRCYYSPENIKKRVPK